MNEIYHPYFLYKIYFKFATSILIQFLNEIYEIFKNNIMTT